MRFLAAALLGLAMVVPMQSARADFLLNCRLMDRGSSVWHQHCKAQDRIIRISCRDRLDCIILKKKIAKSIVTGDGTTPLDSGRAPLLGGNTFKGETAGGVLAGSVDTSGKLGAAVGSSVESTGSAVHGTLGGAAEGAGRVISDSGSLLNR